MWGRGVSDRKTGNLTWLWLWGTKAELGLEKGGVLLGVGVELGILWWTLVPRDFLTFSMHIYNYKQLELVAMKCCASTLPCSLHLHLNHQPDQWGWRCNIMAKVIPPPVFFLSWWCGSLWFLLYCTIKCFLFLCQLVVWFVLCLLLCSLYTVFEPENFK